MGPWITVSSGAVVATPAARGSGWFQSVDTLYQYASRSDGQETSVGHD